MRDYFERVVEVMEKLRSEQGCPWDREQTHESLKPYLLEETYEVLEAIEKSDPESLKEELGDVLLQVVFHSEVAKEKGEFDIEDVLKVLHQKLIRRHPHVFGNDSSQTAQEVLNRWEHLKKNEKKNKDRKSILDGIPAELPALMRAFQLQGRAARAGFDWKAPGPVMEKVREEKEELESAIRKGDREEMEAEMGDLLFALVNLSRFLKIDPEAALRKTNRRFYDRFHYIEKAAEEKKKPLSSMTLSDLDRLWEQAKAMEQTNNDQNG